MSNMTANIGVDGGGVDGADASKRRGRLTKGFRAIHWDATVIAAVMFLVAAVLAALLVPTLLGQDPKALGTQPLQPPSGEHLLGTDQLGRDVLVSLLYGTRVSVQVGLLSAASTLLLGCVIGMIAGFVGGWVDNLLMRITEIFQTMPQFILAAVIVALLGAGVPQIIIVIALLAWPRTARVMRGEILRLKSSGYVMAARCQGLPEWRILVGEVLRNAVGPVIPTAALVIGEAVLLQAALAFLGLGSSSTVSWGSMMHGAQGFITTAWWLALFPGLAILLLAAASNVFADALGDALGGYNNRSRGGKK